VGRFRGRCFCFAAVAALRPAARPTHAWADGDSGGDTASASAGL